MSDGNFRKLLESTNEVGLRPDAEGSRVPQDLGHSEDKVQTAIERLEDWVGMEVTPEQIRAVLWGAAMEKKNSSVIEDAMNAIYDEHEQGMGEEDVREVDASDQEAVAGNGDEFGVVHKYLLSADETGLREIFTKVHLPNMDVERLRDELVDALAGDAFTKDDIHRAAMIISRHRGV